MTFDSFRDYRLSEILINSLVNMDKISQVPKECFHTVYRHSDRISSLDGDIIECGVWKGGFSIFLSYVFPTKPIWVCDSFEGFQLPENGRYSDYKGELFAPDNGQDWVNVGLPEVIANFERYNLQQSMMSGRIRFLKGFVKDTLPTCGIDKISLLRIDVDAYSATREVLDELYPKVVSGGMVIFDDACLYQTVDAMRDYFKEKDIPVQLRHPENDCVIADTKSNGLTWFEAERKNFQYPIGCYLIKP